MLARFNVLPSAILFGRYCRVPHNLRRCPYSQDAIETVSHVLLDCPFYNSPQARFLDLLLSGYQDRSDNAKVCFLVQGKINHITTYVACFLQTAIQIREAISQV